MPPSSPISQKVSAGLHELLDILAAVQHTIVDPLNDLPRDEITGYGAPVVRLCNILQYTVEVVATVDALNGGRGVGMAAAMRDERNNGVNWNLSPGSRIVRSGDLDARHGNDTLKHVPGISRGTVEGLLSSAVPRSWDGTVPPVVDQIIDDLQRFVEPLEAIYGILVTADTRIVRAGVKNLIEWIKR